MLNVNKNFALLFIIFFALTVGVFAQQNNDDDEPEFIVPARPSVSNPAEFQKPGVLQLEYGFDGNFHSTDLKSQIDTPLALRFAVNKRLLLELDTDTPYSETERFTNRRETGAGDTQIGLQTVLQTEKKSRPAVAFAYYLKIPTASAEKNLGTGRFDHSFIGLFSKKFGKTDIDFNAIYLLAGRSSGKGFASSGQAAFAVTENVTKKFGLQEEISGMSRNDEQTGMMFALGAATYKIGKRLVVDGGLRFGLTPDAPRIGIVAGITVGLANLYKKRQ